MKILIYYIIFSLIKIILSLDDQTLFVFQIIRNGARAPYSGVKNGNDLYFEKWEENRELTNIGKRQLYLLGTNTRKRYMTGNNKFLSQQYNPQEIYIKSTDTNRTIESIYSFIQGLYPNGTGQNNISKAILNNREILYPPNKNNTQNFDIILENFNLTNDISALPYNMTIIPSHIFNDDEHLFNLNDPNNCPNVKNLYDKLSNRTEIHEFTDNLMKENYDTFIDLEKIFTGQSDIDENFMKNFTTLCRYMDNLICDDKDLRNFSEFKNKYENTNIDKLTNASKRLAVDDYKYKFNNSTLDFLDASETLRNVYNWMNYTKSVFRNKKYIKHVIYSAHDSNIGSIDGLMNYLFKLNKGIEYPDFSDCRYFEFYYFNEYKYKYKIKYLKGDGTILKDMTFYDLQNQLNKLWDLNETEAFCQAGYIPPEKGNKKNNSNNNNAKEKINVAGASFMIIISVLDGVLIVLLILYFSKKR